MRCARPAVDSHARPTYDRRVWKSVCLAALLLAPATTSAQSLFVQASGGREIKRFSGGPDDNVFDTTASLVALSAGGAIASRVTLSLELDFGSGSTAERTTTITVAGQARDIHTRYTS